MFVSYALEDGGVLVFPADERGEDDKAEIGIVAEGGLVVFPVGGGLELVMEVEHLEEVLPHGIIGRILLRHLLFPKELRVVHDEEVRLVLDLADIDRLCFQKGLAGIRQRNHLARKVIAIGKKLLPQRKDRVHPLLFIGDQGDKLIVGSSHGSLHKEEKDEGRKEIEDDEADDDNDYNDKIGHILN